MYALLHSSMPSPNNPVLLLIVDVKAKLKKKETKINKEVNLGL